MASLRTKSWGQVAVLSEPGLISDKSSRDCCGFVRTWHLFGQNLERLLRFCPNLVSLQTKSRESAAVLSEHGITSDKISRECCRFVRTWYHFRQNHERVLPFCPNLVSLQTKSREIAAGLSEHGITSDKSPRDCCGFVRTWRHFGQKPERLLWFCLNMASLRTKSLGGHSALSEHGISSDKSPRDCCGFV